MGAVASPWSVSEEVLLDELESSREGLRSASAEGRERLSVLERPRHTVAELFLRQFRSPIILLLGISAVMSLAFGEFTDSVIVLCIIMASGVLGFVQERGAVRAVDALLVSVQSHCDVLRDGVAVPLVVEQVVPGDVVLLKTGDVVPGDCRVLEGRGLSANESLLTGEYVPRDKHPGTVDASFPLGERSNMLWMATHIESGHGKALVVGTGADTEFGGLVAHVSHRHIPTSFERGVTAYGRLLVRTTGLLVVLVFLINVTARRPVVESLLFALALAVGLTPQMLPAIITFSLSRGAAGMARNEVVVKRLDSIENIGAMDVLCTDKTGTVTAGDARLVACADPTGTESPRVARLALWNARLHTGFPNPTDDEIQCVVRDEWSVPVLKGEVPFDFDRRLQSVVVAQGEGFLLVTKGSVEELMTRCASAAAGATLGDAERVFRRLASEGKRVLGVATAVVDASAHLTDIGLARGTAAALRLETDMTLEGFLVFDDPVRPDAADAVRDLRNLGVEVRIITGDSEPVARHVARQIGLGDGPAIRGSDLEHMDERQLTESSEDCRVFCGVTPAQKERIVRALSTAGHTVGFVGDGINDAAALHGADVGLSVQGAVDIAKQTADIVMLRKDLGAIAEGIRRGRDVFANTLKYVYVTTSANFGNMVSLAVATAFLPYLPLLPVQILLLNFLSDMPGMLIATDRVDPEWTVSPRTWDVSALRRFMVAFGLVSTALDLLTFAVLRLVLSVSATQLRTGWFLESVATELVVMLSLRTRRRLWQSRPGTPLLVASVLVAVVSVAVPFAPFAGSIGLEPPTARVGAAVAAIVAAYLCANEVMKTRLRRLWE